MCMLDLGDGWKVFSSVTRKARKTHRCAECRRDVAPGETYEYASGLPWGSGSWTTYHTCEQCVQATLWLRKYCDGYLFEMVAEDLREHVDGDEDFMRTEQLATLVAWQEADWLNEAGTLRPVDEVSTLVAEAIAATDSLVLAGAR